VLANAADTAADVKFFLGRIFERCRHIKVRTPMQHGRQDTSARLSVDADVM